MNKQTIIEARTQLISNLKHFTTAEVDEMLKTRGDTKPIQRLWVELGHRGFHSVDRIVLSRTKSEGGRFLTTAVHIELEHPTTKEKGQWIVFSTTSAQFVWPSTDWREAVQYVDDMDQSFAEQAAA